MKPKTYTLTDLKNNTFAYRRNFRLLLKNVGKPSHSIYVKKERELNKQEVAIRKYLGLYTYNPCPTNTAKTCEECTGYYRVIKRRTPSGKLRTRKVNCPKSKKAIKCEVIL